ncbi:hypothetical protein SSCI18S_05911 [Sphingobium scionense]
MDKHIVTLDNHIFEAFEEGSVGGWNGGLQHRSKLAEVGCFICVRRDAIVQDRLRPADTIKKSEGIAVTIQGGQESLLVIAEQEARLRAFCL